MNRIKLHAHLYAVVAGVCVATTPGKGLASTTGQNGTHDPSRMIQSNGKFFVYSTGGDVPMKWSNDGLNWTDGPSVFSGGLPAWASQASGGNGGSTWAPDGIYLNGTYYLYYAIPPASGLNPCNIGLVTSPSLDPSSPSYKWTDRGMVVSSPLGATYSAIDPAPVLDANGDLWVVWGGGYPFPTTASSLWVTRLDDTTGLPSATDPATPGHPIATGHKEGSYLHYQNGSYFLFYQTGSCCNGASSTYTIHVARSQAITGPYTNKAGAAGQDEIFFASHASVHGPGHIGIYNACGADRFTYHYYPDTGGSVLGETELTWGSDGWPVAGADSTVPLLACGQLGGGPTDGGAGGGSSGSSSSSGGDSGIAGSSGNGGGSSSGAVSGSTSSGGQEDASVGSSGGAQGSSSNSASSSGLGSGIGSSSGQTAGASPGLDSGPSSDGVDAAGSAGMHSGCACEMLGSRPVRPGVGALLLAGLALLRRPRRAAR